MVGMQRIRELAARQFGVVTREQLHDAGLSNWQIRARVASGELVELSHRVFAIGGSVDTFERRAQAALFDSTDGAGLSFTTATGWYRIPGFQRDPIHITEPRELRTRASRVEATRHHPLLLPKHHVIRVNGLAVTTPSRTAADLANIPGMRFDRAERAIDSMWARGLTNRKKLARMADEWCERGRRGSAFLHEYLDARPAEWRPPESSLERRFCDIVTGAGFPRPISQVNVGTDEAWFGRCDFLDPELPLIGEVDSDVFHTAPLDVASDKARDAEATRGGFVVVRVKEHEVWYDKDEVIRKWIDGRWRARRAG